MDLLNHLNVDDEYDKLVLRMNPPRVAVDNEACDETTLVKVHSANKHGILLEVVQVLADFDLVITKAHISSDNFYDSVLQSTFPAFPISSTQALAAAAIAEAVATADVDFR